MKNKMLFIIFFLIIFQQWGFAQTDKLGIRLNRAVSIAYHSDQVSLEKIDLDKKQLPKDIAKSLGKDVIYKINENEEFKGYAYVGSAPSKERDFDYLIIFNPDLTVKLGKVLIYRESHGREIGAARWLDQFVGMTPTSTVKFDDNIDSISGATISARSMTRAVGKVLKIMGALDKNNLL
ncbi:MAG TPA: FMN-binding protein [Flavobacteriaceae bacterium]|nr:FMN-binding protein [Flavobacteriaceae bacterium]